MSRKNKGGQRPQNSDNGNGGTITQADNGSAEGTAPEGTTAEAQPEPEAEAAPDPFADCPTVSLGDDVSFTDFSDVPTADPRKYLNVHTAAIGDRLPTTKGWKHERAMLVPGSNKKELKPGTVYGTIKAIVDAAGRAGIPAYVVATMLRRQQIGNKRSHYCTSGDAGALPPVGWAEGWINTALTKNIVGVHTKQQAPALREEVTEGEAKAKEAEAQGKLAASA